MAKEILNEGEIDRKKGSRKVTIKKQKNCKKKRKIKKNNIEAEKKKKKLKRQKEKNWKMFTKM